jgi:Putative TOS1-like glycosyl hydrolase (DUF2401)/Glycine-rich protein domain (DUF2403)
MRNRAPGRAPWILGVVTVSLVAGLSACGNTSTDPAGTAGSGAAISTGGGSAQTTSAGGPTTTAGVGGALPGGLGPAQLDPSELDPPSHGATITFEQIGAKGWYPSRRDPATGPCDALDNNGCCLAKQEVTSDQLTPWDLDLVMTLRGPMLIKQLAVYHAQEADSAQWELVSGWDSKQATLTQGITFDGKATPAGDFAGEVGSECLVDTYSASPATCGAGSVPYCPAPPPNKFQGWPGSKLFVMLATMPHSGTGKAPPACSMDNKGNWYDAPWLGLAIGELARAGSFASCQCFAKDPAKWYLADGCGQFNVFEVVNDNNQYTNLDVFSTNMIGYGGYVGQGPCGPKCAVNAIDAKADLIDKQTFQEATQGALASPAGGPSAAFRRPDKGYRYFLIALDVGSRTVQLGIIHPENVPKSLAGLLPGLPAAIPRATVDAVLGLRLPK